MDEEEFLRRYHGESQFSFGGLDKVKEYVCLTALSPLPNSTICTHWCHLINLPHLKMREAAWQLAIGNIQT